MYSALWAPNAFFTWISGKFDSVNARARVKFTAGNPTTARKMDNILFFSLKHFQAHSDWVSFILGSAKTPEGNAREYINDY